LLADASEETAMHVAILYFLLLVSIGLGLAFMLWVLWNLTKQLAHQNEPIDKQPMISIRVGKPYSPSRLQQRTSISDITTRMARVSDYAAGRDYSAARK
jgi:hypothetical protein